MHIVEFKGGLGNQLFELCFYYKLIEKYGTNNVFAYIYFYSTNKQHEGFLIDKFIKLNIIYNLPETHIDIDEDIYHKISYKSEDNYYYVGYWQSKEYFPSNISFLDEIFNKYNLDIDSLKILNLIQSCKNSVSIHVRRGDYINIYMYNNIANKQYFNNSINYINQNISNPIFFIFSDDIEWCKNNLNLNKNAIYVSKHKSWMDIYLMSQCKVNIISNSTFSWWSKTINKNKRKIILSPKYWFNEELKVKPLDVSDAILIDNFDYYNNLALNSDFSFVFIVNNEPLYKVRGALMSLMNQDNKNINILILINKNDNNLSYIKEIAKKDNRIKIIFEKFFSKSHKIDINLLKEIFMIVYPSCFLKQNVCGAINKNNYPYSVIDKNLFMYIDENERLKTRLYNKCFNKRFVLKEYTKRISINKLLSLLNSII